MRPSKRYQPFNFNMDPFNDERIEDAARSMDLSKTTFMNAVLAGAFARGLTAALATEAINRNLVAIRRWPRATKWISAGRSAYMRDDAHAYMLTRTGHGGRIEMEGSGWYIEGPGVARTYVGRVVREAQETADAIVDRALAALEPGLPLVTKSGRVLTDADIEALADEAEAGYDVSLLKEREPRRASES